MRLPAREFIRGNYKISSDPAHLDLEWVHSYLAHDSYWAQGITAQVFLKSVENSICFGLFHDDSQVGFGRVISDFATFAYLADVFVSKKHRGQGLGKWLVGTILGYPELQGIRRWMLVTRDAHGLYERFGFKPLKNPGYLMERADKRPPGE
jgi:GNAT superfamily N-acetyltransferase